MGSFKVLPWFKNIGSKEKMNPQVKPGKLNELWLKITATGNMYSVVSKTCRYDFENLASTCRKTKQRKNLPSDSTNHHCKLKHLRFSKASFFHEVSWFISHHDSKNERDLPSLLVSHKIKRECQDWTSYYTVSKLNVQEINVCIFQPHSDCGCLILWQPPKLIIHPIVYLSSADFLGSGCGDSIINREAQISLSPAMSSSSSGWGHP